jgi:hypothetical protein
MKPTKSRVMCPDCGKQKMLFESEKKANTFLKFNEEEVNPDGTREMRVYYCPACCGYHISSHPYKGKGRATDKLIEKYREDKNTAPLAEVYELYSMIVSQKFTTRKALNKWLKTLDQYSQSTKDQARLKYYKENPKIQ